MANAVGHLTIDLKALAKNYRLFNSLGPAEVAGIVKANAYGIGLKPVTEILLAEGCRTFFTATFDEALTVRSLAPGVTIALLSGVLPGEEAELVRHDITPVLNSREMLDRWINTARSENKKLSAILHVDTGINRLGLGPDETSGLLKDTSCLENLNVICVMSHFACADEKDHPLNEAQAKRFAEIARHFPDVPKSLANSSGIFRNPDWHYNMIRPGYALYGGNPLPETNNPVRPVIALKTPIVQIRNVRKGESIGYGSAYTFEQDATTATLPVGYADGFFRSAGNKAKVFWNGQPCPVRGRVSMDLVTIEIGHLTGKPPEPGDFVEILGPHQTIDDLAADAGTIGYEILTSLSHRYRREYLA